VQSSPRAPRPAWTCRPWHHAGNEGVLTVRMKDENEEKKEEEKRKIIQNIQ
jgi:hypothetical protein